MSKPRDLEAPLLCLGHHQEDAVPANGAKAGEADWKGAFCCHFKTVLVMLGDLTLSERALGEKTGGTSYWVIKNPNEV